MVSVLKAIFDCPYIVLSSCEYLELYFILLPPFYPIRMHLLLFNVMLISMDKLLCG